MQIKTVKGLKLNDLVLYEGNIFKVKYFPTRNMVCADLLHEIGNGYIRSTAPQSIKVSRRAVSTKFNDMVKKQANFKNWK
jgi:hypothetical protein